MIFIFDIAHSRPTTKALLPFVPQLAPNWYQLGIMLLEEKDERHLRIIKDTHGSDKQRCCLEMLQYWMETHPKATWCDLVTALKSPGVELTAVASDIERSFTGKTLLCTHVYNSAFEYLVLLINFVKLLIMSSHTASCVSSS